jgi:hypothetical protein
MRRGRPGRVASGQGPVQSGGEEGRSSKEGGGGHQGLHHQPSQAPPRLVPLPLATLLRAVHSTVFSLRDPAGSRDFRFAADGI